MSAGLSYKKQSAPLYLVGLGSLATARVQRLLPYPSPGSMTRLSAAAFPRVVRGILLVYSLGFLIGTYTHLHGVLTHGWLAWPVPRAIGVYWDALTLLDPLTVLLLWRRPRVGLAVAVAIMVSDVSVNTLVYQAGYFGPPTPHMVPLSLFDQALFGLLVVVTAPLVWHLLPTTGKDRPRRVGTSNRKG